MLPRALRLAMVGEHCQMVLVSPAKRNQFQSQNYQSAQQASTIKTQMFLNIKNLDQKGHQNTSYARGFVLFRFDLLYRQR